MVVKEIIRPTLPTTQQQSKPPKRRPKQSSANISQASKSSKPGSRVPAAKQTKPEHQRLTVDEDAEEQKPEIVNDEESSTKKIVTMLPVSPRKNESLGSALLKVCTYLVHFNPLTHISPFFEMCMYNLKRGENVGTSENPQALTTCQ